LCLVPSAGGNLGCGHPGSDTGTRRLRTVTAAGTAGDGQHTDNGAKPAGGPETRLSASAPWLWLSGLLVVHIFPPLGGGAGAILGAAGLSGGGRAPPWLELRLLQVQVGVCLNTILVMFHAAGRGRFPLSAPEPGFDGSNFDRDSDGGSGYLLNKVRIK
jgi:hypothetical protein